MGGEFCDADRFFPTVVLFNSINERKHPTTTARWEVNMKRWELILLVAVMIICCIEL